MTQTENTAIVLRYANYRDNDRMVTLLSPSRGRIDAVIRNCRKPKSHNLNAGELFALGDYMLHENGGRVTVTSVKLIETFYPLRSDYDRLTCGIWLLNLAEAAAEASETAETVPTPTPEPYISPIDFASLQAANPDIYAWLELEGTDISYPVVQHPTNDTYYLNHNSDGKYAARGAIFSENYNSGDLSDPVTLLYGHHMQSGAMFGELQQYYSGAAFFAEHSLLILYTPGEERDYTIFAAVPWSGEHLLREYDFSDPAVFAAFFAKVAMTRSLSANFRKEAFPEAGDQVVILSTCLQGNNTQRYLVMAARSGGS